MEIGRSALEVEWRRLEVIAENLANANTSRTGLGGPYRAMRLLSGPGGDFSAALEAGANDGRFAGVVVRGLAEVEAPPRRVHDPAHPHADETGFVSYPGFDHAGEMALLVKTARAYEANIVAIGIARQMYMKAMELGRRG